MWAREGELAGLRYLEVVFGEGVDPDSELPLLVALHGRGDRPRVPGAPFDRLGRPVRVVMPAGPDRLGDGFAWIPYYVLQGRTAELAGSARVAGALLADFLRAFMAERPTFGSPLVSGFSQGGILTWVLAVEHPELIEAAFPLSTWLPPPLLPRPGLDRSYPRIRSLHGEDDRTIPLGPTLESIHALRGGGVVVDFEVFPGVEHYISRDMALRHEEFLREALEAMFLRLTVEPPDGGADAGPGAGSFATLDGG
ncbi:MAG: hypothetical protein H5U40_18875 [Polyangiaceae bacterium]|nr:hypothetical protein [Polyangiaceae bacterium]